MLNLKLMEALKQMELEKGIAMEAILDALSDALLSAYRKNYGATEEEARVDINEESGEIRVFERRVSDAGEVDELEVTPENFGRIAAQTAKQVIIQRIREAERDIMFDEYHGREGDIVTGIVQQGDHRYTLIDLGKVEALLPPSEQARGERYEHGTRLKVYIVDVRKTAKGPQVMVSRTHPGILKKLFELEVPEIYEGVVEIRAVAREAGQRSKVAVDSNDANVDPVGACVGAKGSRVRMIVSELRGEKVDIVEWKEDPAEFVANAISPARVREVVVDMQSMTAEVIVPDGQLSLAIGKEGQNARLAAKLTGWRIDILSESQAIEAADAAPPEGGLTETEHEETRQCRAITASGKRCKNKVRPGSEFCGMEAHRRLAELIEAGEVEVEEFEGSPEGVESPKVVTGRSGDTAKDTAEVVEEPGEALAADGESHSSTGEECVDPEAGVSLPAENEPGPVGPEEPTGGTISGSEPSGG